VIRKAYRLPLQSFRIAAAVDILSPRCHQLL
jgi:hypothetical protein